MNFFLSRAGGTLWLIALLVSNTAWAAGEFTAEAAAAAAAEEEEKANEASPAAAPVPVFSGIGVAVLDTGVSLGSTPSPAIFVPGSTSYVGQNPFADLAIQGTHGTAVAQIILRLTPSSKILSLQTSTGGRSVSGSAVTSALLAAASNPNIRVINHSNAALASSSGAAMLATARADQVVVMGAGNDWAPYPVGDARHAPGLGGKGIIVGGLGPDGEMLGFGNRAGDMAQHYVAAIGSSEFANYWGTSFATPRVSALAARIRHVWPQLRAEEVVSIIKRSTKDKGAPGVDEIYGWGEINPARAFQPLGPVSAPQVGSSGSGAPSGSASSGTPDGSNEVKPEWTLRRLKVPSALYSAVHSNPEFFNAMVIDSIGRDFQFDLAGAVTEVNTFGTPKTILSQWNRSMDQALIEEGPGYQLFSSNSQILNDSVDHYPELLWRSKSGGVSNAQLGFGIYPHSTSGTSAWLSENKLDEAQGLAWKRIDFGRYDDEGFHSLSAFNLTPAVALDLRYSDINDSSEENYHGAEFSAATHFSFGDSGLTLEGGFLTEDRSLLGGASGGPLSVGGAQSQFVQVSGYHRLTSGIALVGAFTGATTSVSDQQNTLMQNFSSMVSDAWLLGLAARSILQSGDSMSITFAQPLRVRSGSADIDIAFGFSPDGEIQRHKQRLNLEPSGVETVVEWAYRVPWERTWNLGAYFALRSQPSHIASAAASVQLMAVAQTHF